MSPGEPRDLDGVAGADAPDRVIVRDKRRLDPLSGQLREPATPAGAPAAAEPVGRDPEWDAVAAMKSDLDRLTGELTGDLQRVTAEYANYRKRVERDRVAVVEMATAGLLAQLLPVLDDIERARTHGDLTGGFKGVGEQLEGLTSKLGLERYGEAGEPFDPHLHEAVMQAAPDPSATVPVCATVLQPGFRVGGRVLRPARVAVADPAGPVPGGEAAGDGVDALAGEPVPGG